MPYKSSLSRRLLSGDSLLNTQFGWQLLCLVFVFLGLYAVAYLSVIVSDTGVALLFAGLWFALAAVLFIRARQKRTLLLLAYLRPASPVSPYMKGGFLLLLLQLIVAAPMAISLLLVLSQGLAIQGWLLLLAALLSWLLIKERLRHLLTRHRTPVAQTYFILNGSVALGVLLALLVMLPLAFWQSMPDLTALAWHEVFIYAHDTVVARSDSLQTIAGYWQGMDFLRIWLAQKLSLGQGDYGIKALVWCLVLLQSILFVLPVMLLLQGASLCADSISQGKKPPLKRQFALVSLSLIIIAAVFWQQWAQQPWQFITGKQVYIVLDNTLYQVPADTLDVNLQQAFDALDAPRKALYQQLDGQVTNKVQRIFSAAEQQIPDYLDWHYSLKGLSQRLLLQVLSNEAENPANRILFAPEGLDKQLAATDQWLFEQYQQAEQLLNHALVKQLKTVFADKQVHPHKRWQQQPMAIDIQQLYQDGIKARMQGSQAAMQTGSAMLLAGASMTLARTLTGQSAKAIAARGASRTATRASPLACVVTGPWFSVCTVVTFVVSSVAIEKGLLMVDEAQHREALQQELRADLQQMQQQLNQLYRTQLLQLLKDNSESIRLRVKNEVKAAEYL